MRVHGVGFHPLHGNCELLLQNSRHDSGFGLAASFLLTRLMSSLMFGITADDLRTFCGVTLFLGAVALLASYLPAVRAARLDPMTILRTE